MEWAALISWIITAGGGFILLTLWLRHGGMRQRPPGRQIRPALLLSHFALAAIGLVLWVVYLASDSDALAWIAFAILAVVAVLGWTMFAIWYQRRQGRMTETSVSTPGVPAEQHFPTSIVSLHGVLAVTTVVLVFLAAVGLGS
jgi:O-antigen/teichoic acid export membrane protein